MKSGLAAVNRPDEADAVLRRRVRSEALPDDPLLHLNQRRPSKKTLLRSAEHGRQVPRLAQDAAVALFEAKARLQRNLIYIVMWNPIHYMS
eukprot:scaffold7648_cov229-Pinguiococcus_pyrenoidosus.AAC.1